MTGCAASTTPEYWQFWLGLALVLLVLFARGMASLAFLTALRDRLDRARSARA